MVLELDKIVVSLYILMMKRCPWCGDNPLYVNYHDTEWGVPVHDETTHFEFLLLEGFQAGLSWLTILKKRDNFRKAFDGFHVEKIANYDQKKLDALKQDAGIIRNRLKIEAAVINAQNFLKVQEEYGSFDQYIWQFVDGKLLKNSWQTLEEMPVTTSLSDTISQDLKSRGFKFVGSTIIYAHIQAIGLVNDHLQSCFRYDEV